MGNDSMKDKDWKHIDRIELQYNRSIRTLFSKIFKEFDFYNPFEYVDKIEDFVNSHTFYDLSQNIATKMITGMRVDNMRNWREAASLGTNGKEIYQALRMQMQGSIGNLVKAQVDRNAFLIRSTPLHISREITSYIAEQQMRGRRAEDIVNDLRTKVPKLTRARANLIARTETSKASTALTRAQSFELGLNWYVWKTSKDVRVRSSHKHMDGTLIKWTNPPSPEQLVNIKSTLGYYNAGEAPNCRCYTSPLIDSSYINFPHKIYLGGEIIQISEKNFKRIM
jgi:SPP1 gp7 family putative phage head morphogenesis protein